MAEQQVAVIGGVRLRITDNGDGTYTLQTDSSGSGTSAVISLGGLLLKARDMGDGTYILRIVSV